MPHASLQDVSHATTELHLRTRAWYGERVVTVPVPRSWDVTLFALTPRAPLSDAEIVQRLETPAAQRPLRDLARGKSRPVIIVDDLNRPTPAARVIAPVLRQFADAGIPARNVTIVMATGTHGRPPADAMAKKVGAEAASTCTVHVHDCHRGVTKVGRTSFGTPVFVNDRVLGGDLVVGIGGIYPNHTAGFGGGSKLVLGVLGFRSIAGLHFAHDGMGWGTPNERSNFRRDLDEIAAMIGLSTTISLLLNGDLDVVTVASGDYRVYYSDMLAAAKEAYRVPAPPADADVVLANAYPADLSLTFTRIKGMAPLQRAPRHASRVVVSPCVEGHGLHGLFPFLNPPMFHRQRTAAIRARLQLARPRTFAREIAGHLLGPFRARHPTESTSAECARPIRLYRPDAAGTPELPTRIPGMEVRSSWDAIVEAVQREQGGRANLLVAVYPSAGLVWLA